MGLPLDLVTFIQGIECNESLQHPQSYIRPVDLLFVSLISNMFVTDLMDYFSNNKVKYQSGRTHNIIQVHSRVLRD